MPALQATTSIPQTPGAVGADGRILRETFVVAPIDEGTCATPRHGQNEQCAGWAAQSESVLVRDWLASSPNETMGLFACYLRQSSPL